MYLIQQVTSAPLQKQTLILPDGSSVAITMAFYPQQFAWFITSLTYKTFTLHGTQITTNPNILHPWRNKLTFGLGCYTQANREPTQQQDFSSGASKLWILSSDEVAQFARMIAGGHS